MMSENGIGINHQVHSSGYIRSMASVPGQYAKKAAKRVSSKRPEIKILFFIPKLIRKIYENDLRQVSGINYLIKMSTYRLTCGESGITWVG